MREVSTCHNDPMLEFVDIVHVTDCPHFGVEAALWVWRFHFQDAVFEKGEDPAVGFRDVYSASLDEHCSAVNVALHCIQSRDRIARCRGPDVIDTCHGERHRCDEYRLQGQGIGRRNCVVDLKSRWWTQCVGQEHLVVGGEHQSAVLAS